MSTFKVNINLQAEFSSQELADFFTALAQSERGDIQPLMRILHPVEPPPPPPLPVAVPEEEAPTEEPPAPLPAPVLEVPVATAEPTMTEALKKQLMASDLSCERLNSIIRRHNWARGQKARIERKWGFSKASCFARIGFHFNDYSLMNGAIKTENDLLQWVTARGFTGTL
jgi:hypothetical protein